MSARGARPHRGRGSRPELIRPWLALLPPREMSTGEMSRGRARPVRDQRRHGRGDARDRDRGGGIGQVGAQRRFDEWDGPKAAHDQEHGGDRSGTLLVAPDRPALPAQRRPASSVSRAAARSAETSCTPWSASEMPRRRAKQISDMHDRPRDPGAPLPPRIGECDAATVGASTRASPRRAYEVQECAA
jgi:hypothetical protein